MSLPAVLSAATSPDRIWQTVATLPDAPVGARQDIRPLKFNAVTVDRGLFGAKLSTAPMEFSRTGSTSEITLPTPDGGFERFRVEEVALMEPELAAKFPEIKTYRGRGIENPAAFLQLDLNARTIHAQVLSPAGAYYIDPVWQHDGRYHMSYYKRDLPARSARDFQCLVNTRKERPYSTQRRLAPGLPANANTGTMLRTYRLACATSLRYSQYHGGTNPDVAMVLAALVTLNNRVSGVYETELGIRMILVGNQEAIIATANNPTPYTDTPGDIFSNPAYIDSKIGEANYDIGHVVTTGSGGIAGLGVVCRGFDVISGGSAKARGTTGINPPVGDPFWIDFVAHEMGHQFGGNHTFDGDDGANANCGPNQNESTAYEPGGGTTIQAYAGICGNEDLQDHSDPYWHFISLQEMFTYASSGVASRPPGTTLARSAAVTPPAAPDSNPSAGTLNPNPGETVQFDGTALGGAAADEDSCIEGVNCDTYTLTLSGTAADWQQKSARITFTWAGLADDYDIFVHKGTPTGPIVDDATSASQPEVVSINPSATGVGTGVFVVRIVYFSVVPPAQQYHAVATVIDESNPGTAPTCAVLTPTGNLPPTVDAGLDYNIPARTPFALTALNGNDPDGDPLTYCWEEADLGPGPKVADAPDDGVNPIIRSFLPRTSPVRVIPRWSDLLANQTQTRGEKLPTTNRDLNFRVTARDNRFGGWAMDQMTIHAIDSGVGFAVTSPNTSVTYAGGSPQTVTWNVANTTAAPINTTQVNILLTADANPATGDPAFSIVLAANTPNDGSESITMPMLNTTKARVMVQAVNNIYFDISNANFTITAPPPQLVSAASRKVHGTSAYDIALPLAGPPYGIECRSGGASDQHTLVFTFSSPVLSVGAIAVSDGTVMSQQANPANPNEYLIQLSGVESGQYVTATLNNVNGNGTAAVTFGILLGDTSGNGVVNASDVGQTKALSGQAVSAANFRNDVTVSDTINSSDVGIVKTQSGTALP